MDRKSSWWKFVINCRGPQQLSSLFSVGAMLTFFSVLLFIAIGVVSGFWREIKTKGEPWPICKCQLERRDKKLPEYDTKLQNLKVRKKYLKQIKSDLRSPLYDSASLGLANNKKETEELQAKQKSLQGESVRDSLRELVPILLILPFSFIAGRLMICHGAKAGLAIGEAGENLSDWKRPFWILVLTLFALQEIREVITSVVAVNKTWFGWSSFCLSTPAWTMGQIVAFGVYLSIGYPACIIWCLSRDRYLPKLERDASDGAWGVGDYILFAQTWSLLIFILILMPVLVWGSLVIGYVSIIYLLPSTGTLIAAIAVAARFTLRAIKIRLLYQQEMRSLGSWTQIRSLDPPPDPTSVFLGDQWWNLPATIVATITAFWAFIEWSPLGEVVKQFIRHAVGGY